MIKRNELSLVFLSFLFFLPIPLSGQEEKTPEREVPVLGEIDPYEVTLFSNHDYEGPVDKYRLQPGMRMLKVPKLDYTPGSILVGNKVGVLLFPDQDFYSDNISVSGYKETWGHWPEPDKWYLVPYYKLSTSIPYFHVSGENAVPYQCSLIIYRTDIKDILGVYLKAGEHRGQFYPLPENANDPAVIYYKTLDGNPLELKIIPSDQMYLLPPTSHPNLYDIRITVKSVDGVERKLPPPNSQSIEAFDLDKLGIHQISTLKLEYKGPLTGQSYQPLEAHRAPPAETPAQAPAMIQMENAGDKGTGSGSSLKAQIGSAIPVKANFNLSETDRPGNNYRNFDLPQPDPGLCRDACRKESRCRAFTYVKPGIQGSKARCWLKDAVPPEKPSDCCVSGVRQ